MDRRVQRTERLLHDALGALIHEKSYDDIAVKEILGRANVGRSTFYSHFRDKHELLVSGINALLHAGRSTHPSSSAERRDVLWFSRPMFEHIDQHRHSSSTQMDAEGRLVVHDYLQQVVVALVADELRRQHRRGDAERHAPVELLARHVAGTFVLVLDWWVESGSQLSASEADDQFRALVQPVIAVLTATA